MFGNVFIFDQISLIIIIRLYLLMGIGFNHGLCEYL
jgi:hypothetical protein